MYYVYTNWENKQFIVKNFTTWIPVDPSNSDYQQYLSWIAEGNVPEEFDPNAN